MSIAVPVTTLAGHIAALQRAGAVAIWPLDDPMVPGIQRARELSGNDWAMDLAQGTAGLPGPYGEATAYQPQPNVWDPGIWIVPPGAAWPPSFRQPQLSLSWWVYYPDQNDAWTTVTLWFVGGSGQLIWWGGWNPGWAGAGSSFNGVDLAFNDPIARGLRGRWTHMTLVGTGSEARLYWDGELQGGGQASPPASAEAQAFYALNEQPHRYQAIALFDRALTDQEVRDLHYEAPAPPTAGGVKVWDGSQWVEGTAKGWDGSQWCQAKVWTGEDWR